MRAGGTGANGRIVEREAAVQMVFWGMERLMTVDGGQVKGRCGDNSQVPGTTEMGHTGTGSDPAPHLLGKS